MSWSGIQISRVTWLFGWIVQCPQCLRLSRMCVDLWVMNIIGGDQIIYHHGSQWWLNPCTCTWSLICFYQRLYYIFLFCCIIVLTWNNLPWFFCVGKGFHLKRRNLVLFPYFVGVWWWEEVRVYLGLSYNAPASFWWNCLGWLVSVVRRWLILDLYHLWWLGSFLFCFNSTASFSAISGGHITICWSILASSYPFNSLLVNFYCFQKIVIGNQVVSGVISMLAVS